MKKIVVFLVLILVSACFISAPSFSKAPPNRGVKASAGEAEHHFKGFEKLDKGAKGVWLDWALKKPATPFLEAMVKTSIVVKKDQKKALKEAGFKYRSVIPYKGENKEIKGSIITGSISLEDIDKLAALDFVSYIEGAKVTHIK